MSRAIPVVDAVAACHLGAYTLLSARSDVAGGVTPVAGPWGGEAVARWAACRQGSPDGPCGAEREQDALRRLPGAGTPRALDLLRVPGYCISVVERVVGRPLSTESVLSTEQAEGVVAALMEILRRAHATGLVHGDVKPSNILIAPDGYPVLIDWELATAVGERARPGSLGYAPPYAWEGGHRATPASDYYSLGVVACELLTGRRLFVGSRDAVVAQQVAARLSEHAGSSPLLQALLRAADSRTEPPISHEWTRESCLRADRGEVALAAARRLFSERIASVGSGVSTATIDAPCDDTAMMATRAIATRWQLVRRENAVNLRDLIHAHDRLNGCDSTVSIEARRERSTSLRDFALRSIAGLTPGLIVYSRRDTHGAEALCALQLEEAAAHGANSLAGWRVCGLEVRHRGAGDEAQFRTMMRDALPMLFGVRYAAPALIELLVRSGVRGVRQGLDAVCDAVRARIVCCVGSTVDVDRRDASNIAVAAETFGRSRAGGDVDSESRQWMRARDALDLAEDCVVTGDYDEARVLAREWAFRAERMPAALDSKSRARLATIWMELGEYTEARHLVLPRDGALPESVDLLRLAGRLYAGERDVSGLRRVSAALALDGTDEALVDAARLEAIALREQGDADDAIRALRMAMSMHRGGVSTRSGVDALCVLADSLRVQRRLGSAARVFGLAQRIADRIGAVRAMARINTNILLLRATATQSVEMATAWKQHAASCRALGLTREAARHDLRAALIYLDVDRCSDAVAAAARATDSCSTTELGYAWRAIAYAVDVGARARRDDPLGEPEPWITGGADRIGHRAWVAQVLDLQLRRGGTEIGGQLLRTGGRARLGRAVLVLLRWVSRGGDSLPRLRVALRAAEGDLATSSPAVGAIARALACAAPSVWSIESVLGEVRKLAEQSDGDPCWEALAAAVHVEAMTWSGVRDPVAARWLRANAAEADSARPFGVFVWEWRSALALADKIVGDDSDTDRSVERALDSLGSWLCAGGRPSIGRGLCAGPFAALADACGLAPLETMEIPVGLECIAAFRAHLRIESVGFRGARGRAAGLERVLRSALRLRSSDTVDDVLREVVSGVLTVCRAERAVVVRESAGGTPMARVATLDGIRDVPLEESEVSLSVIEQARRERRALVFDDACRESGLGESPSVRRYRPRSLMISPLMAHGDVRGFVYVENRSLPKTFSGSDVQLLEGFAAQAGLALENARLVEELRESLAELRRVRTEAVRAESLRVLGQMAGEVAHDFNNLLAVVLGETQLLLQEETGPEQRRALSVIERAALDGATAIRRIQYSTRVRSRDAFKPVVVGALVQEVLDFTRIRIAASGGPGRPGIRCIANTDCTATALGFAPELREVFTNLVVNAADAMPEGGDLWVSVTESVNSVVVCVRDSGVGISEDLLERVFEPFFSTKGERGNGLGLAIAREIVRRHDGAIRVESQVGKGTAITVELPRVGAGALPLPSGERTPTAPREAPCGLGRSALVVDDEAGVRRVLVAMLVADGFEVASASSGSHALEMLECGRHFDVIVTDLYMPGTSGIDVVGAAKRMHSASRVVLMSGCGPDLGTSREELVGADAVLAKPFTVDDVRAAVVGS